MEKSIYQSVTMHFRNNEDRNKFAEIVDQRIAKTTKEIYFNSITAPEFEEVIDPAPTKVKRINPTVQAKKIEATKNWVGMPEFTQLNDQSYQSIKIHFYDQADVDFFKSLVEQKMTKKTKSMWFPKYDREKPSVFLHKGNGEHNPQFPMYIVSKGRATRGTTAKAFDKLGIKYYVIVEQFEEEIYKANIEPQGFGTVIVLPKRFQDEYDTFDDLGETKSKGPGAARNFAWEHSTKNGFAWHWVFDDNVSCFYRLNKNRRLPVSDGTMFKAMEDFCLRYKNIAQAGPNYLSYAPDRKALDPYILNWRVYSMLLIRNDVPFRWRGRYNEDTDLSIRMMREGWCTIQFNAFLGDKGTTQTMAGGNSDDFYFKDGTYNKSKMLEDMHPDISKVIEAYGRWHHKVDYTVFEKNQLQLKDGLEYTDFEPIDEYGMNLIRVKND